MKSKAENYIADIARHREITEVFKFLKAFYQQLVPCRAGEAVLQVDGAKVGGVISTQRSRPTLMDNTMAAASLNTAVGVGED